MQNYSCDHSGADIVLFSAYTVLHESGYSGSVVIDAADADAYVSAGIISQQLPGMLLFIYNINANSKNPHLPFSFKSCVFALPDGGHL